MAFTTIVQFNQNRVEQNFPNNLLPPTSTTLETDQADKLLTQRVLCPSITPGIAVSLSSSSTNNSISQQGVLDTTYDICVNTEAICTENVLSVSDRSMNESRECKPELSGLAPRFRRNSMIINESRECKAEFSGLAPRFRRNSMIIKETVSSSWKKAPHLLASIGSYCLYVVLNHLVVRLPLLYSNIYFAQKGLKRALKREIQHLRSQTCKLK